MLRFNRQPLVRMVASRILLPSRGKFTARSEKETKRLKDRVAAQLELEQEVKSRVACYPQRVMTRPVLQLSKREVLSPLFSSRLLELNKMATDVKCISFSAPKGHWDAAVILIKSNPDESEFEVWVNPTIPGYEDMDSEWRSSSAAGQGATGDQKPRGASPKSVAPMYGMWENCISCGACNAWVVRPQRVTVRGWDMYGNEKVEVLSGMRARCVMHELDHLNGKTILHRAMGAEFIVSSVAMGQRDLWPPNFPCAEAYVTWPHQFFDYVRNEPIIPPGMEWWVAQNMSQDFEEQRLKE